MDPVDLLVFGPHPDDLEIGLGGTIAKHVAHGHRVGLCDLTAGEMGSNGTVDERLAEAEAARAVLGAAWRVNLRWPDRAIGGNPEHVRAAAALVRTARPRAVAIPYGIDRHPDHVAASQVLTEAVFNSGLRRYDAGNDEEAWRPEWVSYYFINDSAPPSFVVDVSASLRAEAACATLSREPVQWGRGQRRGHPPDLAALRAARRESGCAIRRARGRGICRGRGRQGLDSAT